MAVSTAISVAQLSKLNGLAGSPLVIDVRVADDYQADQRLIPGSIRRDYNTVSAWGNELLGKSVVVSCQRGLKLSQGVAAWLRHQGVSAETLECQTAPND